MGGVASEISEALAPDRLVSAIDKYRADNKEWFESRWVVGGVVATAAAAVGYGIYRANQRASAADKKATAATSLLGEMGISREADGVLSLSNVKLG